MKKIGIMIAFLFVLQINASSAQTKAATEKMFDSYFMLKNALASDSSVLAATDAKQLQKEISAVKSDLFSVDEKNVWLKETEDAQNAIAALTVTTDIAKQRKIFSTLSNAMIKIARVIKTGDKPIFLQYCPMAKASWLNEKKDIENPYYGKSMFDCGTVKEVLNVN